MKKILCLVFACFLFAGDVEARNSNRIVVRRGGNLQINNGVGGGFGGGVNVGVGRGFNRFGGNRVFVGGGIGGFGIGGFGGNRVFVGTPGIGVGVGLGGFGFGNTVVVGGPVFVPTPVTGIPFSSGFGVSQQVDRFGRILTFDQFGNLLSVR